MNPLNRLFGNEGQKKKKQFEADNARIEQQMQPLRQKANARNAEKFRQGQINQQQYQQQFQNILGNGRPMQKFQLSGFDRANERVANTVSENKIARPVLTGLASWSPTNVVGETTAYIGRGLNAAGWDKGKYLAEAGDNVASYSKATDRFANRGKSDMLISGGIGLGGDVANMLNPITRAGTTAKFFGQSANNLSRGMENAGYDPKLSFAAGTGLGLVSAGLERTGLNKITGGKTGSIVSNVANRIPKTIAQNTVAKGAGRIVNAGLTEGTTEGLQQLADNIATTTTYDKTRGVFDGVADSAMAGGVLGGIARGGMEIQQNVAKPPTPLTPVLQDKRNGLINAFTAAQDSNRPDLANGIAKQIDQIDNPPKGSLREKIRSAMTGTQSGFIGDSMSDQPTIKNVFGEDVPNPNYVPPVVEAPQVSDLVSQRRQLINDMEASSQALTDATATQRGAMGIVPKEVMDSPEIKKLQQEFDARKNNLAQFNKSNKTNKDLQKAIREELIAKRTQKTEALAPQVGKTDIDYDAINKAQNESKGFMTQMIDKYQPQKQGRSMKITDMMSKSEKAQMNKLNKVADDLYSQSTPVAQVSKTVEELKLKDTLDKLDYDTLSSSLETLKNSGAENSLAYKVGKEVLETKSPEYKGQDLIVGSKEWQDFQNKQMPSAPEKPKVTLQEGRANQVLDKKIRYNGKVMTRSEYVDALKSDGYIPTKTTLNGKTKYSMKSSKGDYFDVSKIEYDRATPVAQVGKTDPKPFTPISQPVDNTPAVVKAIESNTGNTQTVTAPSKPKTTVKVSETTGTPDKLTKTQALPPTPPRKPPVGFDEPPLLGTGKQKATKYASKTIPDSKYVSKEIQDATKKNAPLYTPENEKVRYNQALTKYEKVGRDKFENDLYEQLNAKKGTISSSTVAEAQTLAAKLDAEGNFAKASEIYDKISEHLTAAGQTIQAAAIMSRRTPEGLKRHARMSLTKSGIKITPVMDKELTKLTQAVRLAKTDLAKQKAIYAVGEFVKKSTPDNIWNKSINIWRAGLLTSPMTTAGNLFANASETAIRKGIINPVSTIADMAMGAFTGKRTMALAGAGSGAKGFVKGAKTLPEYMKTGFQPGDANLKAKYDNSGTINYGNGKLGKTIGGYVNGIYRLMGVADAPFRMTAESEVLSSMAKAEAINRGLKGEARKQFMEEFMANPPKEVAQRVADEGTRATFQNDTLLNDVASGLKQKLERKSAPAKAVSDFVMPFVRTPSAIATRMIERTPIGVAKEITNQILAVRAGKAFDQRAMSQAIGNGTFGTLAIGAGLALANSGLMTFGYPSDSDERKLWDLEGKQSYSVKIGDRWYSLNYLQPFGTLLAIGGQAGEDINSGSSMSEAITKALGTAGQSIQEQSFLKGINGVLSTISDPERSARKYMEQTFSSVTPNAVRSYARASDDVQREPTTITDSIKSGIPGLRDNTPVKKDAFGRDLPAKDTFLNQFINPLRPSKVKTDPLTEELRKLKDADLATFPTESNKNVFGKDKPLAKDDLNKLNSTVAKSVAEQWHEITKTQEYKNLSDEDKKKTLDSIKRDYGTVAKAQWAYDNGFGADYNPDLTAKQESILNGEKPSYFEQYKTTKAKTTKTTKTTTKKSTKKTSSKKSGGTRSSKRTIDLTAFNNNKVTIDTYKKLNQLLAGTRSTSSVEPRKVATRKAELKQIRIRS